MEYTYYFNESGACICRCDIPTDRGNYKERGESRIVSTEKYEPEQIKLEHGEIVTIEQPETVNHEEEKATQSEINELVKSYVLANMAGNKKAAEEIKKEYVALLEEIKNDMVEDEESEESEGVEDEE